MNLHVRHRRILILEAALKPSLASPEQRELVKAGPAMTEFAPKKKHTKHHVVTVADRISDCASNLRRKLRSQGLIGIHQKDPIVREWQRIHRPLPFLRPASPVMELHNVRPIRLR